MNGVSALLVVALLHFAGADIDTARSVTLNRHVETELARRWELADRNGGNYRFLDDENGELYVQRLARPDMVYAVAVRAVDGTVLRVASVALGESGTRTFRTAQRIEIGLDQVVVAFAERSDTPEEESTRSQRGEDLPAGTNDATDTAETETGIAGRERIVIDRSAGLITAAAPFQNELIALRYSQR